MTQTRRTRSWWGWGHVEDALSDEECAQLTDRVRALIPDADLTVHDPPDPHDITLPAPRIELPGPLAHLASDEHIDRLSHSHGKAIRDVVRALHGEFDSGPDQIVRPTTEQDVVDVLSWAGDVGVVVIPFGGGSSVVGGVEPRVRTGGAGVVSLDMSAMDRVLELDEVSRSARIQAGTFGPHLEDQLRPSGYTLRHFPQSFEFSTVGGWLATRAGGHYATGYTHIDDLTQSLRVVSPAGVSESRRLPGSGAGPSPDRMFLGSEGILGVITEAWLRVQPRPRWKATASVAFAEYDRGVDAVRELSQSGLAPSNCRLLDPVEAMINAGSTSSVLVLGFESADHPVQPWMGRALEIARDHSGELTGPVTYTDSATTTGVDRSTGDAAQSWRSSFIRMPYQRDALAARGMIVETFESACTWSMFPALKAAVEAAAATAMEEVGVTGALSCRFTHVYPDGPAPYFGVYGAGEWGRTVEQWDHIKRAVSDALIAHGGTITHHHAVGRDHVPWYREQRPDLFAAALRAAKDALDPAGVLNPGVLLRERT